MRREPNRRKPGRQSAAEQNRPGDVNLSAGEQRRHEKALRGSAALQLAGDTRPDPKANRSPRSERELSRSHVERDRRRAFMNDAKADGYTHPARRDVPHHNLLPHSPPGTDRTTERKRRRARHDLRRRRTSEVEKAGTLRGDAVTRKRASRADQQALQGIRVEVGTRLREQRRRTRGNGRGCTRTIDRPIARGTVRIRSRLGRFERNPRSDELGLHAPVEGETRGREAGDVALTAVRRRSHGPERHAGRYSVAYSCEKLPCDARGDGDGRDRTVLVEGNAAGRQVRTVEEGGDGARTVGVDDALFWICARAQ